MKKKRLLASIVTAAMLFTMVPSYALADDSTVQMIDLVPATPTESTQTDVPDSTACTMTEGCTAEVHQDGCPAAQPETQPKETGCTMREDCTAVEHEKGCPAAKPVADEPETETEQTPEPKSDVVAKIGEDNYTSLDDAVEKAEEGATIELLADCQLTKGFNKTLTFKGNKKISIPNQLTSNGEGWMCFGLYDTSRVLTFDGVEVEWMSDGTAPWLMLSLSGTLNVTNGASLTFIFDSKTTKTRNAIYMNEGAVLNVTNGSTFQILGVGTKGTAGQGIQLDKTAQSDINVTGGSTFLIDGTNRGYVNSPNIYVEDSSFTVQNCTSNAANGGNFKAVRSEVYYTDNAGHGLSAGDVILEESTLLSENNGLYGVYVSGDFKVDGKSKLEVIGNSYDGDCAGLNLTASVTNGLVESGAEVTITDNKCSGFSSRGVCEFEEGVKLTIMNNVNDKGSTSHGGGIYNTKDTAQLILPSDAVIYNNHAVTSGDDIYNTGTITFSKVGSGWTLDDCDDDITGWYDDSEGTRWQGHESPYYTKEFSNFDESGVATITGALALKAAHSPMLTLTYDANGGAEDNEVETYTLNEGVSSVDVEVKDNMFTREGYTFAGWADASGKTYEIGSTITLASDLTLFAQWKRDVVWDGTPVGKTATPLDENYESNVTLSLPAAEYKKAVDVVFAIDCSSVLENNSEAMTQALTNMVQELAQKDNIVLNIGVVGFSHTAGALAELQEVNAENVDDFMAKLAEEFENVLAEKSQIVQDGGTNLQVGIRVARRLLDSGEAMPQNRHLILMTDGAGYYYCRSDTEDTSVCTVHNGDRKQCLNNMDATEIGGRTNDSMYMRAEADDKTFGDFIAEQGRAIEESAENSFSQEEAATAPDEQCYTTAQVQSFDEYPYLNMERGTYFAAQELLKVKDAGYQIVTIGYRYKHADSLPSLGAVSSGFCEWTQTIGNYYVGPSNNDSAEEKLAVLESILGSISNELGQFVDAGSQIIDEIGSGTDSQGKSYDFNFINDVNRLKLTVGDTTLNVTKGEDDATYNFGTTEDPDQFVLHYYAGGTEFDGETYGECFVLDINVPVTVEQPVTLAYAVDLTNPQSEPGTYNQLNTNNIAILYPIDSDGNPITPVEFPKPVVSYTVEESSGGGAHHPEYDPDDDNDRDDDDEEEIIDEEVPLAETPWLNTVDHYAYIVGYPEDYVTGQPTEDESRWPVKPQANISRAEVATIFFRLLTDEARDQFWMTTNNFPDVAPDAWYNNAISTMVNAGIIQGYEDGTFRPNNNITRAEFAAIASRFMSSGYDVEEDLFTDIANHWARENINDAAMTQWIHGYPDGTFLPDQAITRAEAVTLVNNVLQRKPHADHMLDTMIKWPDNPEGAWYYEAIQEATNSHDYDLFEDAEYETWTALQENRDWAALEKDWVNTHRTGGEVA
ncbi:hypothetical protein B5F17_11545 [Butyricicoccus pullicaecorum]|uniref:VWFA domain-containing protein n=1 Tax=Butyricicoccus pullicaecorum TaxID=501571 RepID=A0A1Y4L525_9FIRM|nr:S-layer homology domain-containing protein [Butyricicoccus pullicaecorum]OUP51874.1 hypothetical protein B5F17_11545 [Butyricicoccus pullicaecorum]